MALAQAIVIADNTQVKSGPTRVYRVIVTCVGGAAGDLVVLRDGTDVDGTMILSFVMTAANESKCHTLGDPGNPEDGATFATGLFVSTTGDGLYRVWILYG